MPEGCRTRPRAMASSVRARGGRRPEVRSGRSTRSRRVELACRWRSPSWDRAVGYAASRLSLAGREIRRQGPSSASRLEIDSRCRSPFDGHLECLNEAVARDFPSVARGQANLALRGCDGSSADDASPQRPLRIDPVVLASCGFDGLQEPLTFRAAVHHRHAYLGGTSLAHDTRKLKRQRLGTRVRDTVNSGRCRAARDPGQRHRDEAASDRDHAPQNVSVR